MITDKKEREKQMPIIVHSKGKPSLPRKEGYNIFLGTLHRGNTARGKEICRDEMYVKENTCYHDRNREDADFNIYEVVKSHFRKKKDETEEDFEHRISDCTNINVWMLHKSEDGFLQ